MSGARSLTSRDVGTKGEIQILKTDVNNLKRNVESEKQKRLHLDFYSRRENLRLIGVKENGDDECVKENGDEDCEKLVRKILDEMGVLRYGLDFQGHISPYKFLVPCLSVRVKFTNQ